MCYLHNAHMFSNLFHVLSVYMAVRWDIVWDAVIRTPFLGTVSRWHEVGCGGATNKYISTFKSDRTGKEYRSKTPRAFWDRYQLHSSSNIYHKAIRAVLLGFHIVDSLRKIPLWSCWCFNIPLYSDTWMHANTLSPYTHTHTLQHAHMATCAVN